MVKNKLAFALLSFLLFPYLASAQLKQDTKTDFSKALVKPNTVQSIVGLIGLDPNRFSMSHSYTFSVGSFGGESYSQGQYLNTMKYQLSNPITMYLQLGFQHQPLGALNQGALDKNNQVFLSGAGFEYKPSETFQLQFEFSQRPNSYLYSPYSSYRRSGLFPSTLQQGEENQNH